MTKSNVVLVLVCAVGLLGCQRSKLHGTVEGEEFGKVESAFFMESSSTLEELLLVLTNYAGGCVTYDAYFRQGSSPAEELPLNALFIRFQLQDPVEARTYDIVAPDEVYSDLITWVHAWFRTYSEEDGWIGPDVVEGAITISSIDESSMSGTLEVTLSTGDVLDGKFSADFCDETL